MEKWLEKFPLGMLLRDLERKSFENIYLKKGMAIGTIFISLKEFKDKIRKTWNIMEFKDNKIKCSVCKGI